MRRRMKVALGCAAIVVLLASTAAADERVCVAANDTPFFLPGTQDRVGWVHARACYAVMGRDGERTKIWVTGDGFAGEVEVDDRALARILVDDVEMRLEPASDPHGLALSGAIVTVVKRGADGNWLVKLLEGRVHPVFLVAEDEIYWASTWPEPDPEFGPGKDWPVATRPLPPGDVTLTRRPGGYDVHAEVGPPLFRVDDVLLDPAMAQLAMEIVEGREYEAKIRIVGAHMWVEGWVTDVDWRAEELPEKGWDSLKGVPAPATRAVGSRQLGDKPAELAIEVKGDAFGSVPAGAWVDVVTDEGKWIEVVSHWDGGQVRGWTQSKYLLKEKKQGDAPTPKIQRLAAIGIGQTAVEWFDSEGHDPEVPPETTPELVRGLVSVGLPSLKLIYAQALDASGNVAGELTYRLVVDPDGVVLETSTPVATLTDTGVREATDALVEGLVLPEREKLRDRKLDPNVIVWVQIQFKPLGQ